MPAPRLVLRPPGRHHDHEKESHATSPQLGNLFSKIGLEIQNLSHRHPRRPHGPYSALQISCWGRGRNGATVDVPYLVYQIPAELSTCTHMCTCTLTHTCSTQRTLGNTLTVLHGREDQGEIPPFSSQYLQKN